MAIQKYYLVLFVKDAIMYSAKARQAVTDEFLSGMKDAVKELYTDGQWPIDFVTQSNWVQVPNADPIWAGYNDPGWAMYYEIQTLPNRVETEQEIASELSRRGMFAPERPVGMVV